MDEPRILIVGTSYVGPAAQSYGERLVTLWAKLAMHLNPDCDILVVDSASPNPPAEFLKPLGFKPYTGIKQHPRAVFEFADNIGHLNVTGRDGWGRAISKGIELAWREDYDYIAYMDVDIVFTRAVRPIIEKMAKFGVCAACPMDTLYNFLENGLMFLDVGYLEATDFVARYDWPNRGNERPTTENIPEMIFEKLLEDAIFTLPLRGLRNDLDRITVNNLANSFPYGIDYLTHCKDFALYERLLEMKGITL